MTITSSTSSSASAFTYLIPAQIPGAKHITNNNHRAVAVNGDNNNEDDQSSSSVASAGDEVVYLPTISEHDASSRSSNQRRQRSSNNYRARQRTGDLPDVHWRSIPMSHLRCHPNFQPLPPPSRIDSLPTREHVRNFRQEAWQWDWLHRGRCTTSQTAAALGFLESKAAVSILSYILSYCLLVQSI